MKIPKFWFRKEGTVAKRDGGELSLMAWGWSETSRAEAGTVAAQRFGSLVDRVKQGLDLPKGYAYGTRPMREEILEELQAPDGNLHGLLTRNSYGSVVLNAAQTMFIDVDLPEGALQEKKGWIGSKGGGAAAGVESLRQKLTGASSGSFRIYRTAAGLRVLATDHLYAPKSGDADRVMQAVGADPAFIQLCHVQESFRARLTPKPWRVGTKPPPVQFPREHAAEQSQFAEWLGEYEQASSGRATCRFVEAVGAGRVDDAIAPLMR